MKDLEEIEWELMCQEVKKTNKEKKKNKKQRINRI